MTEHPSDTILGQTLHTMTGPANFPTTRWTLVLAASGDTSAANRDALAYLCERYWYPLYAYVRRGGYPPDQAKDLTQSFFALLLERKYFERANPDKGHFRSFLLSSLKFFLSDEAARAQTQKRGGGTVALPFEIISAETLYEREPFHDENPERIFERRWAHATLDHVIARLRDEFVRHGRLDHFNRLKVFLLGQAEVPYAELAKQLDTSEGALKVGIHRLRKRYRELLRGEIADTVASPDDVEGELRYLAAALTVKRQ
jgi:RNA polymerase sigma factor (sigma-70 family)